MEKDGVICNLEIIKGVFLANSIIPKDGYKHIKLLNVTDKTVKLEN